MTTQTVILICMVGAGFRKGLQLGIGLCAAATSPCKWLLIGGSGGMLPQKFVFELEALRRIFIHFRHSKAKVLFDFTLTLNIWP